MPPPTIARWPIVFALISVMRLSNLIRAKASAKRRNSLRRAISLLCETLPFIGLVSISAAGDETALNRPARRTHLVGEWRGEEGEANPRDDPAVLDANSSSTRPRVRRMGGCAMPAGKPARYEAHDRRAAHALLGLCRPQSLRHRLDLPVNRARISSRGMAGGAPDFGHIGDLGALELDRRFPLRSAWPAPDLAARRRLRRRDDGGHGRRLELPLDVRRARSPRHRRRRRLVGRAGDDQRGIGAFPQEASIRPSSPSATR